MKSLPWIVILAIFTSQANATLCTSPIADKNKLVKKSYSFTDTSPLFKKNRIYSYKAGTEDIDVEAYSVNFYGNKLTLTGNSWKWLKLTEVYQATPNTILEFEFRSTGNEAEINGVAPITYGAQGFHSDHFFQVYGTQNNHNQDYHDYSGNKWKRYQIPIWDYLDYTSEKRIYALVFAGDDDGAQVNQRVMYKNIRLIEQVPSYQLPIDFQYLPPVVNRSANKNNVFYTYSQMIMGPDNNTYPVSDGSIVMKYYEPVNSSYQYLLSVHENYYQNLCWDNPINYTVNIKAKDAWDRLQTMANTQNIEGFKGKSNTLYTHSKSYFDPDFQSMNNDTSINQSPQFIHEYSINSNNSLGTYVDKVSAHDGLMIENGISYTAATKNSQCNQANSGQDSTGVCHDLTGLTSPSQGNWVATNNHATVRDADHGANNFDPDLASDEDNIWNGYNADNGYYYDSADYLVTDMLTNTKKLNDFLVYITGGSNFTQLTGWRMNAIVNAHKAPSFQPPNSALSEPYIYLRPWDINVGQGNTVYATDSKSKSLVGHEFSHALTYKWFSDGVGDVSALAVNEIQGCAINEGYGDIFGLGFRNFATGTYSTAWLDDHQTNGQIHPSGERNIGNPLLTGDPSYYDGDNQLIGSCIQYGENPFCSSSMLQPIGVDSDYCFEHYGNEAINYHSMGVIIGHLYHLMTNSSARFNADVSFKPDGFGISADEKFTVKGGQKLFFDALKRNAGHSSAGSTYTFCDLRDDMLLARENNQQQRSIQQAWKHVYKDIQTICQLPQEITLAEPGMVIKVDGDEIADNELIDFGAVEYGQTLTKTFRVVNTGEYPLRLIDPIMSNSEFSQSGLQTHVQVKVEPGIDDHLNTEYAEIEVSFTADANNSGFNQGSLTFETNMPNGTEDQHFFTINFRAFSTQPQNNADAYEEDDVIGQAQYLATEIEYNYIPQPWPPGYDCNSIPWVGLPPLCETTFPVPVADRNFSDDNVDWVIAQLYYRGDMGPFPPFALQISNFEDFSINICYEAEDASVFTAGCVSIASNTTHIVNFSNNIWAPPEGLEYKIKLTNPNPSINYEYLAVIR
jgi:hypothetical protein